MTLLYLTHAQFQCSRKFVGPLDMSDKNPLGPIDIFALQDMWSGEIFGAETGVEIVFFV